MTNIDKGVDTRAFIGQTVWIEIDRPMGSTHPRQGYVYPVNYGFVPGVPAPDGGDLDAYLLGVFVPVTSFQGVCIAVLHRLDDDDDKLILAPARREYSDDQIRAVVEFQERFFLSEIWR